MIRPRRDEDLKRCVPVLRRVYESDGYPTNWPNDPAGWVAGSRPIAAWVAEEGDRLVGHVALTAGGRVWPEWPSDPAVVSRLFVDPDWQGRGVGAALMACAEREAAARGLPLVLDVAVHNCKAIAYYESRGWRRVGEAALPPGDEGRPVPLVLFVRD